MDKIEIFAPFFILFPEFDSVEFCEDGEVCLWPTFENGEHGDPAFENGEWVRPTDAQLKILTTLIAQAVFVELPPPVVINENDDEEPR